MRLGDGQWSVSGLQRELEAIERVFQSGSAPVRLSALCWMAVVVGALPPGEAQEQAEDRLSALIAEARLEGVALGHVLAFRRYGTPAGTWPSTPTLRR